MAYFKSKTYVLPVGRTMATHKMSGSFQKSFMDVDVLVSSFKFIKKKLRKYIWLYDPSKNLHC